MIAVIGIDIESLSPPSRVSSALRSCKAVTRRAYQGKSIGLLVRRCQSGKRIRCAQDFRALRASSVRGLAQADRGLSVCSEIVKTRTVFSNQSTNDQMIDHNAPSIGVVHVVHAAICGFLLPHQPGRRVFIVPSPLSINC